MIDPLYVLRDVEVPVGARARVRARIEDHLDRAALPKRRALSLALAFTATAALAALLAFAILPRSQARRTAAVPAQPSTPPLIADDKPLPPSVAPSVIAPSPVHPSPAPSHDVIIDEAAAAVVIGVQLTVRVIAGSVHVTQPVITTETIELTPPPTRAPAPKREPTEQPTEQPTRAPAPKRPPTEQPTEQPIEQPIAPPAVSTAVDEPAPAVGVAAPAAPPPADKLAEAVREYRAATALETRDPAAAVLAWQAWRTRWAHTALAHGADLRLLALLGKLDRQPEAASVAKEFLRRYPRSPRRGDVERVLEGAR